MLTKEQVLQIAKYNTNVYYDEEPVYMLIRNNKYVETVAPCYDVLMEKGIMAYYTFGSDNCCGRLISNYGYTWVCFSHRPSEEEIEAVNWLDHDDPIPEDNP